MQDSADMSILGSNFVQGIFETSLVCYIKIPFEMLSVHCTYMLKFIHNSIICEQPGFPENINGKKDETRK